MTTHEQLHTVEELLALPDDGKRYELIEGEFIEMPPSSKANAILASFIIYLFWDYVLPKRLGFVTGADSGYYISATNFFQPDAGFISRERAGGTIGVKFLVAPDLAVEIISPTESARDVLDKTRAYLKAGASQVWSVYPKNKVVDVHRLAENGSVNTQTLSIDDTLDGGEVLPGFTLKLRDLFAVLE